MTQNAINDKEAIKAAAKAKEVADAAEETKLNEGRKGKGTRATIGYTRGRSTQRIVYEAFDETQPATLPENLQEFLELSKTSANDEKTLLGFLIDGFNSNAYTTASDPIAEYVNPAWDSEVQKQFRLVVRNYANSTDTSIEDSVALIKPGVEKAHAAKQAAKASA